MADYQRRFPHWACPRREDVSRDPLAHFERLYASLGLGMTTEVRNAVQSHSNDGRRLRPDESHGVSDVRRNSARNIHAWRKRLSRAEIRCIREGVANVAAGFYGDEDW